MRIALFGLGSMGRHHARHLAAHDLVRVDPPKGELGDISGIEAAVIAAPTTEHARIALPLLERGIPCLIEKPLAATLADARALAPFPHLMVGHIERYNPAFSLVRGVDARFVQAERLGPWLDRSTDVDVVLDLMIHDLDLFLALSPEAIREVRANGVSIKTGRIDIAHARVETVSGRVGTFVASRVSRVASRKLRVVSNGEYWSLDLKDHKAHRVRWGADDLSEEPLPVPPGDALGLELAAFIAAVRGEGPYSPGGAEGLRVMELAMRVNEAIRSS